MQLCRRIAAVAVTLAISGCAWAQSAASAASPPRCQVSPVSFEGWSAQQISNHWLRLIIVPQLGGRVMQVTFGGHDFLFVNPKFKGKYIPPAEANDGWINYGGDKIWPMPEGDQDEHHWVLKSDALDDGEYQLRVLSQGERCSVLLQGPPDPTTGLQYARKISVNADSPVISFHAVMKNIANHPIIWSVQSVSQYNLADPQDPAKYNHDFYAFTPVNHHSAYFNSYQVRAGLADDPSFSVKDGMFQLHWLYLDNEVWLDSPAGWLAVVDGATQFAMVERFKYEPQADYPGSATVIFYKNGAALGLDDQGMPKPSPASPSETPYYMEAEINSPMVTLQPGATYAFDTDWFPTRSHGTVSDVHSAGLLFDSAAAIRNDGGVHLAGTFGVFYSGNVIAEFLDDNGIELGRTTIAKSDPATLLTLNADVNAPANTATIALHVVGDSGADRGLLDKIEVKQARGGTA